MSSEIQSNDTPVAATRQLACFALKVGLASLALACMTLFGWFIAWEESIRMTCLITHWDGMAQLVTGVMFMIWMLASILTAIMAAMVMIRCLTGRSFLWRAIWPSIGGLLAGAAGVGLIFVMPPILKQQPNSQARTRCYINLRQMDAAKQQWALENKRTADDIPAVSDVTPFLKNNVLPTCPASGTYTLNAISADPTCSIPGHTL